jgi:hypothetical protein
LYGTYIPYHRGGRGEGVGDTLQIIIQLKIIKV